MTGKKNSHWTELWGQGLNGRQDAKTLRSFGLTVGAVFTAIGVWPVVWSQAEPRLWALVIGAALIACGGLAPQVLRPVHRAWMAAGHVLGWINTRLILGVFFYGILTPLGLLARLTGKDFMRLKPASGHDSYRVTRSARPPSHLRHQF